MEHDVDLVLRAVGIGVDGVAAPLLDRVARGSGPRLLPRGGSRSMVSSPVVFLPADLLGAAFLPLAAAPLFFGAVLAIGNGSSLLVSALSLSAAAVAASSSLVSSSLKLSLLESLLFSVIKRWKEEGGVRCNVKKAVKSTFCIPLRSRRYLRWSSRSRDLA